MSNGHNRTRENSACNSRAGNRRGARRGFGGNSGTQRAGVAVPANGLDSVFPAANRGLAERLPNSGDCPVSACAAGVGPGGAVSADSVRMRSGLQDGRSSLLRIVGLGFSTARNTSRLCSRRCGFAPCRQPVSIVLECCQMSGQMPVRKAAGNAAGRIVQFELAGDILRRG